LSEAVVVDTDVVSFGFKSDTRASLYAAHLRDKRAVVSFMTVAELYLWPEMQRWGEHRRSLLAEHMKLFTVQRSTEELCRIWAGVMADAAGRGRAMDSADAWIAATALLRDLPLITHNGRHYEGVEGLQIICEA
jgi:predicted nucleic acid-binding protein